MPFWTTPKPTPEIGLILSGGGARAAYQVGVLKAVAQLLRESGHDKDKNPFPIIVGTSAGAINAAGLACGAHDFQDAVARIVRVWEDLHASNVYRTDTFSVVRTGARWLSALSLGWTVRKWSRTHPKSLLDNSPLASLLPRLIDFSQMEGVLASGAVSALAITASSYSSGQHITFYQASRPIEPWMRTQRLAVAEPIRIEHLLASSSIPFVFPAEPLPLHGRIEYFGDGAMRQIAPIGPAIHLGAQKVLVVGAGRLQEPLPSPDAPEPGYPSLAQIAGHALSSIFLDGLAVDIERLMRINKTLELLPSSSRRKSALRPIEVLVIAPSQRLDDIAAHHVRDLPPSILSLFEGVGATETGGAALASYLLFECSYTCTLIELGFEDTMKRKDDVLNFLLPSSV